MEKESYIRTAEEVYRQAAEQPDASLCCAGSRTNNLPGLKIPVCMSEMNYGCGTTVHMQDLSPDSTILYVGVGGGMEALEFAYFTRKPGGVIAVDSVQEMIDTAKRNFQTAEQENDWFRSDFVDLRRGDALKLPLEDESVELASQNCLFNIFKPADLGIALSEFHRVLKPGGAICLTDPVSPVSIPDHLKNDERLRACCLSGAISLEEYLKKLVDTGFGTIEIRSRKPYRVLDARRYDIPDSIMLESVEMVAYKTAVPDDGPCVFTGCAVFYLGEQDCFDDGKGHILMRDVPLAVCDKTAQALKALNRDDLVITGSTYHYAGGGCC
ncbi:MAG: arsenosugar biosynthesis arsenite methyltransferase ArsM [bacterium]